MIRGIKKFATNAYHAQPRIHDSHEMPIKPESAKFLDRELPVLQYCIRTVVERKPLEQTVWHNVQSVMCKISRSGYVIIINSLFKQG